MDERELTRDEMEFKAKVLFEEESQDAKDFLEKNIDEITTELLRLKVTDKDFTDLFQNEIEKYTEYIECD